MLGYLDAEALRRTLTEGRVTFWSRSRQEYWRKGDTSGNVQKPATLETGATVNVPLFIRVGDTVKIDTRTHEYVERVNKT